LKYEGRVFGAVFVILFLAHLKGVSSVSAEPISEYSVGLAAKNWVTTGGIIGESSGTEIETVTFYRGKYGGNVGYHLVTFNPRGWAIFPGDTDFYPVSTFGADKITQAIFEQSPFYEIIYFNLRVQSL
jgi:hypothetical protein